jgi:predicted N-acyltransferase
MKGRTVKLASEISEIPVSVWDALASPPDAAHNPFTSHAFLHALEASGSVGGETGWHPAHVVLEDSGRFVAVAPAYVKSHS